MSRSPLVLTVALVLSVLVITSSGCLLAARAISEARMPSYAATKHRLPSLKPGYGRVFVYASRSLAKDVMWGAYGTVHWLSFDDRHFLLADGRFEFGDQPAGVHVLKVEDYGFSAVTQKSVN